MEHPMPKPNDLSRSPNTLDEDSTLIAVIEMGLASWLVAGRNPGLNRNPVRKQDADPDALLARLYRWRDEAGQAGHPIRRIVVAFEAGRDGF
jgi:transposase